VFADFPPVLLTVVLVFLIVVVLVFLATVGFAFSLGFGLIGLLDFVILAVSDFLFVLGLLAVGEVFGEELLPELPLLPKS
jgi:hypothetical protein